MHALSPGKPSQGRLQARSTGRADRFGTPVKPREWLLLPLQAIDEAVKRIVDGAITNEAAIRRRPN